MDHSEEQNDLGELLMTNFKIIIIEALWKKEWIEFLIEMHTPSCSSRLYNNYMCKFNSSCLFFSTNFQLLVSAAVGVVMVNKANSPYFFSMVRNKIFLSH